MESRNWLSCRLFASPCRTFEPPSPIVCETVRRILRPKPLESRGLDERSRTVGQPHLQAAILPTEFSLGNVVDGARIPFGLLGVSNRTGRSRLQRSRISPFFGHGA